MTTTTQAVALLLRLAAVGITVSLRPDGTPSASPKDRVTQSDWSELKANREAVLALLKAPTCRVVLLADNGGIDDSEACQPAEQLAALRAFAAKHPGRKIAAEWRDDQWKWHRFVRLEATA